MSDYFETTKNKFDFMQPILFITHLIFKFIIYEPTDFGTAQVLDNTI